jgi:hypothetical protein
VLNGQVDLLNSAPLATMQAIGARRKSQKADPFNARFSSADD